LALRISCVVLNFIILGYAITLLILCAMNKLPAIWISYKIGATLYALALRIPILSIYTAVKHESMDGAADFCLCDDDVLRVLSDLRGQWRTVCGRVCQYSLGCGRERTAP
jgi:hypothetical protein